MNDMNDDFELPPLPKETVFSSEVGDIDEENDRAAADDLTEAVAAPSMTDMDGNHAEPPPAENYKSANRRETVIREMAELPPQKSAAERRQEYLDELKRNVNSCRPSKGRSNVLWLLYRTCAHISGSRPNASACVHCSC